MKSRERKLACTEKEYIKQIMRSYDQAKTLFNDNFDNFYDFYWLLNTP